MNKILKRLKAIDTYMNSYPSRKTELIFCGIALASLILMWVLALFGGEDYGLFTDCEDCEDCKSANTANTANTASIERQE